MSGDNEFHTFRPATENAPWPKTINHTSLLIMPPPLIGCLMSVCLSVAYIGPNSRTERPRKTKIGTEVAHVTRDSDATFKVKRSTVKVTRPLYSARP